jgi:hypothetical protein
MRRLGWLATICLCLTGCATVGSGGSPQAAPSPTPSPALAYRLAGGAHDLVLRVDTDGGLVAPGFFLTHLPGFSLYGDGTAVFPGPVDTIYPSPLLPNLRAAKLSAAEMQRLMAAADDAGLLGPDASYPADGIADAPTTTFTTTVDGATHTVSAYALGIDASSATANPDREARVRLAAFQSKVADLGTFLDRPLGDAAYGPDEMRVFASQPTSPDPNVTEPDVDWPLAEDPGAGTQVRPGTSCLALAGAELAAFTAVAKTANALTVWVAPSGRYSIGVRPLLPDETGCPTS